MIIYFKPDKISPYRYSQKRLLNCYEVSEALNLKCQLLQLYHKVLKVNIDMSLTKHKLKIQNVHCRHVLQPHKS